MMLPQHLEALLTGSDDSSGVPVDAEWLDRVRTKLDLKPALLCYLPQCKLTIV